MSSGHYLELDYPIGTIFGKLTVISEASINKYRLRVYNCQCECGNTRLIRGNALRGKSNRDPVKDCGCEAKTRHPAGNFTLNNMENDYKKGAKSRGYEYSLTKEQFKFITSQNCFYCGSKPRLKNRYNTDTGHKRITRDWIDKSWIKINGIDRKNNSIGYTVENSVSCCKVCNFAKKDMEYNDFIEYLTNLTNYRKNL